MELSTYIEGTDDEALRVHDRTRSQIKRLAMDHRTTDEDDGSEESKWSAEVTQQPDKDLKDDTRVCCTPIVDD